MGGVSKKKWEEKMADLEIIVREEIGKGLARIKINKERKIKF